MKLTRKPKPPRASNRPGWLRLTIDELIHWAHAWKSQQTNPDRLFRENEMATARIFKCGKSTINRRNAKLVEVGVARRLHEKERGENQRFIESTLCITVEPPACILTMAKAAAEARALMSPEPKVGTAPTRINSGDEPCPKVNRIATDSINPLQKPVSIVGNPLGVIEHSSRVDSKVGTAETRMNSEDEPRPQMGTDAEIEKISRKLRDAEKKLARLRRDYGDDEAIVVSTSKDVAELRSCLQSKVTT